MVAVFCQQTSHMIMHVLLQVLRGVTGLGTNLTGVWNGEVVSFLMLMEFLSTFKTFPTESTDRPLLPVDFLVVYIQVAGLVKPFTWNGGGIALEYVFNFKMALTNL